MRAWLTLAALLYLGVWAVPFAAFEHASAAPQVEVRARTVVQLKPILRTRSGITVSGTVTDRASPEPIPNAPILITIDGEIYTALTDDFGRFELRIPAEEGVYDIIVSYPGDRYLDPSGQTLERFDVSNKPLELSLTANAIKDNAVEDNAVEDNRWELVVRAQSAMRGADVSVVLWGGDTTAPELAKLGELVTDERGRARLVLTRAQLGGFGDKRIEARFTGDGTYDAATASTTFSIGAATTTTFRLTDSSLAFEDTIRGRGKVSDEDGVSLAGQRVVMEAGGRELDETMTDKNGAFELDVEASELGEGKTAIQAVLYPQARWLAASRSKPVTVNIDDKKPVPLGATLAAFGATCAALLAFVAMRTKPWTKWLERFAHRAPDATAAKVNKKGRRPPGLAHARPSLVSTLRRPHDFGFSGQVFDVVTSRPIAGATIAVLISPEGASDKHTTQSEDSGAFAIEDLPVGHWRATVSARGYMPETFELVVPHKGELRNAHVDLLAVREHIFDLYGALARPLLPDEDRWGVWTPRQIFEHVRSQRRAASLQELTDSVEDLYFSQRTPDVDAVLVAETQIAKVSRELGGPAGIVAPSR